MISTSTQVPDMRNRIVRRGMCSHCGWYEDVSKMKAGAMPDDDRAGAVRSTAKYRIIM